MICPAKLSYRGQVFREWVKSIKDRRRKALSVVCKYADSDGNEYRKTFETTGCEPVVPLCGSSIDLNLCRYQWTKKGLENAKDVSQYEHVVT